MARSLKDSFKKGKNKFNGEDYVKPVKKSKLKDKLKDNLTKNELKEYF